MSAGIFVTDYLRPAALKVGVVIPDGQQFGLHSFIACDVDDLDSKD